MTILYGDTLLIALMHLVGCPRIYPRIYPFYRLRPVDDGGVDGGQGDLLADLSFDEEALDSWCAVERNPPECCSARVRSWLLTEVAALRIDFRSYPR